MQGRHLTAALAALLLFAGCRSTDTGYDGGTGFTASAQCSIQCQDSYRHCVAQPRSNRLSACESELTKRSSCAQIKDPEQRRYCDMSASSCADRMPELGCGETLGQCTARCG